MSDQDNSSSKVDLSSLPEPMRSMLLKQLDKMPATLREKLLREGSPMLDRVIANARATADALNVAPPPASAANASHASPDRAAPDRIRTVRQSSGSNAPIRVQTVSPGDSANGGSWLIAFVVAAAIAGYFWLRG